MKKGLIFIASGFLFLFMISSCYYDNVEDLYPYASSACDTTNVTYSQTIAPIMAANCNVCHSTAIANGNVITDTWEGLSVVAKNGQLWNAVDWTDGVNNMPQGGSKLSDCNLAKINIWIKAGSLNN
jgi:hypothetical protein